MRPLVPLALKRALDLPASLWLAVALVALILGGGVISLGVQGLQSKAQARATASEMTGGDPKRGEAIIGKAGCGACHTIPGVKGADATVGPSLDKVATRAFIAGRLSNTPDNLVLWVQHPQTVEPGSGMPDPGLSQQQARDVAAYLYTLD